MTLDGCITSFPFGVGSLSCRKELSPIPKKSTINQLAVTGASRGEPGAMLEAPDWELGVPFPALSSVTCATLALRMPSRSNTLWCEHYTIHDLKTMYTWSCVRSWAMKTVLALGLRLVICKMNGSRKWSEVKVAQSCLTLCDPMDYTVHGIL